MTTERAYTVLDTQTVKDALTLDHDPVGLQVEETGQQKSCTVHVIPPTDKTRNGLAVSNTLLQELLEEDAIEAKNPTDAQSITVHQTPDTPREEEGQRN